MLAIQGLANDIHVTLAYGTTATGAANRGLELSLSNKTVRQIAGLHRPTRFVLARRLTVTSTDPRFDLGASNDPTIGRLPDHALDRLTQLAAFLGRAVTDDRHRGRTPRRRQVGARGRYRSVVAERREITIAGLTHRASGRRGNAARTVIVEHRRKRVLRPATSAA